MDRFSERRRLADAGGGVGAAALDQPRAQLGGQLLEVSFANALVHWLL
jgi:hypothetical protein